MVGEQFFSSFAEDGGSRRGFRSGLRHGSPSLSDPLPK